MSWIQKQAIWYRMLNKCLWKKPGFLIIMCMVPLLAAGMRLASKEESGIVTIAVYAPDGKEAATEKIMEQIEQGTKVLQYVDTDSEEEAYEAVRSAQADMAWIFPADLQARMEQAAKHSVRDKLVTAAVREDTVVLRLAREKLYSALYASYAYAEYQEFIKSDVEKGNAVSERELRENYEKNVIDESLFQMVHVDGGEVTEEESDYLLAPLRGMLSLWLILCGLAASMFYIQDEKNGVFSRIPVRKRNDYALGFHMIVIGNGAVVMLAALGAAGLFTDWKREMASMLCFAVISALFCNMVRQLCRTRERLGACIPILLLMMFVMCPVFFDLKRMELLPVYLLPPYYYLKSIHGTGYFREMILYGAIAFAVSRGIDCIQKDR